MEKQPKLFLSSFVVKVFAIIFMTIDHIGVFLQSTYNGQIISQLAYDIGTVFRYAGRLSFPLFIFLAVEGVRHTRSFIKYAARLGLMAVLLGVADSIIFYAMGMEPQDNNAFLDILCVVCFCHFLGYLWKEGNQKFKAFYALIPLAYAAVSTSAAIYESYTGWSINVLWFPAPVRAPCGIFGIVLGTAFYVATPITNALSKPAIEFNGINLEVYSRTPQYRRGLNLVSIALMIAVFLIFYALSFIMYDAPTGIKPIDYLNMSVENYGLICALIILFYNGEKGYSSRWWKYFSYAYLPLHMVLLYLIFYVSLVV